jgi:hypothetical protein
MPDRVLFPVLGINHRGVALYDRSVTQALDRVGLEDLLG